MCALVLVCAPFLACVSGTRLLSVLGVAKSYADLRPGSGFLEELSLKLIFDLFKLGSLFPEQLHHAFCLATRKPKLEVITTQAAWTCINKTELEPVTGYKKTNWNFFWAVFYMKIVMLNFILQILFVLVDLLKCFLIDCTVGTFEASHS